MKHLLILLKHLELKPMKNLADYLHDLEFDYLKTFSGLRGPIFDIADKDIRKMKFQEREKRNKKKYLYGRR